jgi:hypothetical protein
VKMSLPEVLTQKITAFGADNVLVIGGRIEGDTISALNGGDDNRAARNMRERKRI